MQNALKILTDGLKKYECLDGENDDHRRNQSTDQH